MKQINLEFYYENKTQFESSSDKALNLLNSSYLIEIEKYYKINRSFRYSTTMLILNNLISKGLKQKIYLYYCKIYKIFYLNILNDKNLEFSNYYYYSEFKHNLQFNFYLYNIENCFSWYLNLIESMFYLKCSKIEKKYRKKTKNFYKFKFTYILPEKRLKRAARLFFLSSFRNPTNTISGNFKKLLYLSYCDYMLNFKKSKAYIFKKKLYKQMLKIK